MVKKKSADDEAPKGAKAKAVAKPAPAKPITPAKAITPAAKPITSSAKPVSSSVKSVSSSAKPVSAAKPAPPVKPALPSKPAKLVSKPAPALSRVPPQAETPPLQPVPSEPEAVRPKKRVFRKAEMEQFRDLLLRKRARLSGDLTLMHTEALRATDDDVSTDHMADYGSDRYEQDFTLGLIENEQEIVRHIDDALERIDTGEYGICQQCSSEIGLPRLQAIPYVRFCIDCQRASEVG